MSRTHRLLIMVAAIVAIGVPVGAGYWWGRTGGVEPQDEPTGTAAREVLYWYDPMVPDQHFDRPGPSPFMDMPLVPRYADEEARAGVAIDPGVRQNLGVRTVEVERGRLPASLSVPGVIAWDPAREHVVSARVDAVVDRLFVRTPFASVRAGEPLASLVAPEWSAALAEAQALHGSGTESARQLRSAARSRLRALGLPAGARVRDGRIVLVAPVDGVVSEIAVREGATAPAGTLLFRISGTETVWVEAALPQASANAIAPGTPARVRVSTWPGRVFEGRVDTLLPQLDAGSRTQQARIVLANPDGQLAAGMFAEVTLDPDRGDAHLLVPADAVIDDGTRTRAVVMGPGGRFRPVPVQVGRSGGGKTEIVSGLREGDSVVASGQFLIDSEASLSGALERLTGGAPVSEESDADEAPPPSKPHDAHASHDHGAPRP